MISNTAEEDRAEGLAGASVSASLDHVSQSSPDHQETGDRTPSHRRLTEAPTPGAPKKDPDRPKPEDRYKP
ncbi:hypothetical protein [Methylobacterium sp. CM6247]